MTKGCGVNKDFFGEVKGDLVKPGMTQRDLEAIEAKRDVDFGADPFADVFAEAKGGGARLSSGTLPPRASPSPAPEETVDEAVEAPVFEFLKESTFDGTEASVASLPQGAEQKPSGSFSVDFWVRLAEEGSGYRSPLGCREMPPPRGWIFFVTPGGQWAFWLGLGAANAWLKLEGPDALAGEWQRVTGTYQASSRTAQLFVDGEIVASKLAVAGSASASFSVATAAPLRLGGGGTEGSAKFLFKGSVRGVRVYARALGDPLPDDFLEEPEPSPKRQRVG